MLQLILLINGNRYSLILTNPLPGSRKPGSAMQTFQRKKLLILSACIPLSIFNSRNDCFLQACTVIQTNPILRVLVENSYSTTIGWYATEFQKIEIEGKAITSNIEEEQYQILFRWIFVIGTHGAHQY